MGDQHHAPAALTPGNKHGTHFTGGMVDPSAILDAWGSSRPLREFDPRTVQAVASRYAY